MVEIEDNIVRLQQTIAKEAVGNHVDDTNQVLIYERLNEDNLTSHRVCPAPGTNGLMFYVDKKNQLFVSNTQKLKLPLASLEEMYKK